MFNLKKIEPKFPKPNPSKIQRKMTYTNNKNDQFINLDLNISERESEAFDLNQFQTLENNKLNKNDLLKKIPIKLKPKSNQKNKKYRIFSDNNSTTTNCSDYKGIKKVTFSTIEIIRVAKYKKYNASNNFSQINIEKNIKEVKDSKKNQEFIPCTIF